MPDDALESVLRLVAEGRLTAEEAGPILDALAPRPAAEADASRPADESASTTTPGRGQAIRLEILDGGHKVVNLRVPLALGRAAIARVPGLSDATLERLREAIDAGLTGPVLDVDEGTGDAVRVVIE
jgi:hypothetical protein